MIETGNLPQPTATRVAIMHPPAFHDPIEKGIVIHAPVALDCWTETKSLTASMAAMSIGMSVSTHHINDPGYLPPRLILPSLTPVDTMQVG
jgi:hypothetical protein